MKKSLKNYFIPHHGNDYKPHSLREEVVGVIMLLVVFLFAFSLYQPAIFTRLGFLANILPSVLIDLTNDSRAINNISALEINPVLEAAAKLKAQDMAKYGYFSHNSPDGITPWYWFGEAGYGYTHAGENLAIDFFDSKDVNSAWLDSPSHRANILNEKYTEIGIATAEGVFNGRKTTFVVQFFGNPSELVASPVAEDTTEIILEPVGTDLSVVNPTLNPVLEVTSVANSNELVANVNISEVESLSSDVTVLGGQAINNPPVEYSNALARAISAPRNTVNYIYFGLGTLVFLSLLLGIFIEIKHQHPLHVACGIILLALITLATLVNQMPSASSVTIL